MKWYGILAFIFTVFALVGFVHIDDTFAETQDEIKDRVTNAAMQDAKSKCADSKYSEIQMRQIATTSFNKSPNLPGNMFPLYQSTFVDGCTTMQVFFGEGIPIEEPIPIVDKELENAQTVGYTHGNFNKECETDDKPTDLKMEGLALLTNPYNPITQPTYWKEYVGEFKRGCLNAYEDKKDADYELEDKEKDYRAFGIADGDEDRECYNKGKSAFENGGSETMNYFEAQAIAVFANPYKDPTKLDAAAKYQEGFVVGCSSAYATAYIYAEEKSKAPVGSFFDDDDLGGCLIDTAAYGTELAPEV